MYHAHPPPNHPRDLRTLANDDAVGKWLNNSEIAMVTSYTVDDNTKRDGDGCSVAATYVLRLTDGRATVKDAKLKVTP
jgi:hypothetical protein